MTVAMYDGLSAAVEGHCLGGGLALAAVCDLRVATRSARFAVPIARTLGNCLSVNSVSVLVSRLGAPLALDMLLAHAPITQWASKVAVARLRRAGLPDGDDVVARAYGSQDFHRAVAAFGSGDRLPWQGT